MVGCIYSEMSLRPWALGEREYARVLSYMRRPNNIPFLCLGPSAGEGQLLTYLVSGSPFLTGLAVFEILPTGAVRSRSDRRHHTSRTQAGGVRARGGGEAGDEVAGGRGGD